MHDRANESANTPPSRALASLGPFLRAWCDAVSLTPADLADRAEAIKHRWANEKKLTDAELKRFGSSRPHFYRLLKGNTTLACDDHLMLAYLAEVFEVDVVQLFDALAERVWPIVHLTTEDYLEAPLQDPEAIGARYLIPLEQLAGCPMHHLFIELAPAGQTGQHRHIAGTEMIRLEQGEHVTLHFPHRAKNRREITLQQGESVCFDATHTHQIFNPTKIRARLFVSRNYQLEPTNKPDDANE